MLHRMVVRQLVTRPSILTVRRFAWLAFVSGILVTACTDGPIPPAETVSRDTPTSQAGQASREAQSSSASVSGKQAGTQPIPNEPRRRQTMSADSIRQLSAMLDKFAASSSRGAAAVALRRQILVALSAPTEAAYQRNCPLRFMTRWVSPTESPEYSATTQ